MLNPIALLALAALQPQVPPPAAPATPPPPSRQAGPQAAQPQRYGSLWVDWRTTAPAATAAETAPASAPGAQRSPDEAADLGARVGEMVATGNCRGGEQLALDAGDLALARAVRDYCSAPAGE